jgi:molybdopterin molybdotransferase
MPRMSELLRFEEALAKVLERVERLPGARVPLAEAAGRFLVEPAAAAVDLPPFPSSAMDGFAVRVADTPGTLPIAFRIAAGRPAPRSLEPGEAMAIATGGVVPEGADAVIPHEYVVYHDNTVEIVEKASDGANVRPRGGDVRAGDVVVEAGARVRPGLLGALAAAGIAELVCARRPRAAVLTTGTELRRPGEPLAPGEVYEANGVMLAAQLASSGVEVERLGVVADDEDSHRAAIERGLEHDVLVTSGGVSVGPHDLVRRVEAELGVEEVFWRVAVKPGKPVSFAVRGKTLVFGLPGNPVSSFVGCELFVRPALLALQGATDPGPAFRPGRLARAVRRDPGRTELLRARTSLHGDGVRLDPITGQESHMIVRAATADALVLVEPGDGELPAGSPVRYLELPAA